MSSYCHHTIIVQVHNVRRYIAKAALDKAIELGMQVTPIVISSIEGFNTFYVTPDGSKEGWADSDVGDLRRHQFIEWIEAQKIEDEGDTYNWISYTEVSHSEDDGHKPKILRHNLK